MTGSKKVSLLILSALMVVLLLVCVFIKRYFDEVHTVVMHNRAELEFKESIDALAAYDSTVYYIGNIGGLRLSASDTEMLLSNFTIVNPAYVSDDTMPVPWETVDTTFYDSDGEIIKVIPGRTYSDNMIIIVAPDAELSESGWDTVRRSAVDNGVPVLLLGSDAIRDFHETLLWAEREHGATSFVFRSDTDYEYNPFEYNPDEEEVALKVAKLIEFVTDEYNRKVIQN